MALNQLSLEQLWAHIIARLGKKVDKEDGKGLSSCDFTQEEKEKLSSINPNTVIDWTAEEAYETSYIANKPTEYILEEVCTWDGNIEDKQQYILNNNTLYKISDRTDFTKKEIEQSLQMIYYNGSVNKYYIQIGDVGLLQEGYGYAAGYCAFVTQQFISEDGTIFTPGIYSTYGEYYRGPEYVTSVSLRREVIKEKSWISIFQYKSDQYCKYPP